MTHTTTISAELEEKMYLGIPYDAAGFKNWLVTSRILSEEDAAKQIDLIREADIEFWEPGEPELFKLLGEWLEEARKAESESVRTLYIDFAFTVLITHIQELEEMKESAKKEWRKFLADVIGAFQMYEAFLRATLNYYDFDPEMYADIYESEEESKRYPKIPLDSEFNQYLKELTFSDCVRYKMVSNLRKLNALVINNGRGESDWLQSIADKAKAGVNIRYTRLTADRLVHSAIANIDGTEGMTEDMLRGALSTLNHYLDFLIKTYLSKKNK